METGDLETPHQKRLRLDSVNPPYNPHLPPPPPPPQAQPSRHPAQPSSPPRPYPPAHPSHPSHTSHGLPHLSPGYPPPGGPQGPVHYAQHHPPPSSHPSHPSSDLRAYSESTILRPAPSPHQRSDGYPVTLPALSTPVSHDRIHDYHRTVVAPRPTAPETHQPPRPTSDDIKSQPVMDHSGQNSPWPPHPDPRTTNGTYTNGYARVVSPPNHHEQQFQTPPLPPGHGGYTPPASAYPTGAYMGGSAAYPPGQARRKQARATQACNNCRSRKQKCDELRPCGFCKDNNHDCQYKDVPPPKQDRSMMQLQDTVSTMLAHQERMMAQQERMNGQMMEQIIGIKNELAGFSTWRESVDLKLSSPHRLNSPAPSETLGYASRQLSHLSIAQQYGAAGSMNDDYSSRMSGRSQTSGVNGLTDNAYGRQTSRSQMHVSNFIKEEPQMPESSNESYSKSRIDLEADKQTKGLKGDHTTPAHRVLQDWPSMKGYTDGIEYFAHLRKRGFETADYPMKIEQDRGLVRVWGVGEGLEANVGSQSALGLSGDEVDNTPSPPGESPSLWGKLEPSSPSTFGSETPQDPDPVGGLGPDGRLRLDDSTLWDLHKSYMQNIHILQPFMNPSELRRMVKTFGQNYGPEAKRRHAGVKRKRSESGTDEPLSYEVVENTSSDAIHKSISNAIVLLVLALGKVCQYKQPLPGPQPDKSTNTENTAWGASSQSVNHSFSSDSTTETRRRNIDILPGMAYFSVATDILGNQNAGNTTMHAQAMLLAGLYAGQYARVLESWSWINNACRVTLVLIKAEMPNISRTKILTADGKQLYPTNNGVPVGLAEKDKYRLDLIKCVYWACLQLESDILAEMSTLAPTQISNYQEEISYPMGVFETFPDPDQPLYNEGSSREKTMWMYSSQIHLRVILNEAHNTLYNRKDKKGPTWQSSDRRKIAKEDLQQVAHAARIHSDVLSSWRRLLPPPLKWDDSDPPSTDLNMARLRAKFYGGQYMILRPFLYMAIHDVQLPPEPAVSTWSSQTSSPAAMAGATPPSTAENSGIVNYQANQLGILRVASDCIDSAIQSTIAFDRVGRHQDEPWVKFKDTPRERFIVTNIFGTLHAQFGNMIVLSAVWNSRLFRHVCTQNRSLTKENLRHLFDRTIKILRTVGANSPVLSLDADILENVRYRTKLDEP